MKYELKDDWRKNMITIYHFTEKYVASETNETLTTICMISFRDKSAPDIIAYI